VSVDDRERFAVIPTKAQSIERLRLLDQCLAAICPQVHKVFLIDNTPDGSLPSGGDNVPDTFRNVVTIKDPISPVNLSYLWNLGIEAATTASEGPKWDVAIINDDAIVPHGWFEAVSDAMREHDAAAGCGRGTHHLNQTIIHHEAKPVSLYTRMTGHAFILAGEKGARANEQLKWWFGDDHLDWMSRKLGGVVVVRGYEVRHLAENGQVTPELQEQIAKDAAAFMAYWGMRPW
jgi:hypothetical protein